MLWKRLSLTKKIFVTISLTAMIIVAIMASLVALSMRDGFAKYLLQAEINRFDDLEVALSGSYDVTTDGWPELVSTEESWLTFVFQNLNPRPLPALESQESVGQPPDQARREKFRPMPPPRGAAPPRLINRIGLLDQNGEVLAGATQLGRQMVTRAVYFPGRTSNSKPIGWISLSAPTGDRVASDDLFIESQYRSLLIVSLMALALSFGVALILARQFLIPIRELTEGSSRLASGDFTSLISHRRHDELGKLMDDYNILAESLAASEKAERKWITDASHELHTPLAVLRAEIEALQDGVRQPTAERLESLHTSVMRLSSLVSDINTLSRTREGRISLNIEEVQLASVIGEAVSSASAGFKVSGIKIKLDVQSGLMLNGDRFRLRQVFDNLLENSKRYTSSNGKLHIQAKETSSQISIIIEDSAPSPPTESIQHLFKRFYRVEQSRSRELGGSGLGLSICKSIISAHGGRIEAQASELGGLKIAVSIPKQVAYPCPIIH